MNDQSQNKVLSCNLDECLQSNFPRKHAKVISNNNEWSAELDAAPACRHISRTAPIIEKVLQVTCNNDTNFAAEALKSLINNNESMQTMLESSTDPASDKITLSLKNWISNQLGKVKKREEKMLCMF